MADIDDDGDLDGWKHVSAVSTASTPPRGAHSFAQVKADGRSCDVCGGMVAADGFFLGLECSTCHLVLHEACRGMCRSRVCASPRLASQKRLLAEASAAPAPGAKLPPAVSSPKNLAKVKHVSFRVRTAQFSGLDGAEDVALFFGAPLNGQPRVSLRGYPDRVPVMLALLAQELDRRGGFDAEGVFRLSTESSALEAAKDALNAGKGIGVLDGNPSPHLFAALIKDLFRSLPPRESLLGSMSAEVLATLAHAGTTEVWADLLFTPRYLPSSVNRAVFLWTLDIMAVVVSREAKNKMNLRAISIVFAPSLWEAPPDMPPLAAMNAVKDVASVIAGSLAYVMNDDLASKERRPMLAPASSASPLV